jgi:hypothetical protein
MDGDHEDEEEHEEDMEGESKFNAELDGTETLDDLDLDDVLVILEVFNEKRRIEAAN